MKYIKSLDGLRGIAVLLVLFYHWNGGDFGTINIELGTIGVYLFFVLSGFLISTILLQEDQLPSSKKIKIFYLKRALRILPIYYLFIAILFLIDYDSVRNNLFYYLLHIQNFLFTLTEVNQHITHLWSLAVEEQFYLFWPLILLMIKPKYVDYIAYFIILFTPICNLIYFAFNDSYAFGLPFFAFEGFAWGYLASRLTTAERILPNKLNLLIAVLLSVVYISFSSLTEMNLQFLERGIFSFLAFTMLMSVLNKEFKLLNNFLELRQLVFIGKISYGVYLYHRIIPELYFYLHNLSVKYDIRLPIIDITPFPYLPSDYMFFVYLIITLLVSIVSFYLIEKPLLNLKQRIK